MEIPLRDGIVELPWSKDNLRYKYFARESNEHQAKMELRTYQYCVSKYTKPGDTILDPMSGTGTVHFANYMGRNTVGIELVPRFVELQKANLEYLMKVFQNDFIGFYSNEFNSWDFKCGQDCTNMGTPTILEGDARRHLPLSSPVDAIIFSPPYGNLWAKSSGKTAKVTEEKGWVKGYDDNPNNVGNLNNYAQYLIAMKIIYGKCFESLKSGGILVTIVKDYVEKSQRKLCSKDNLNKCLEVGFSFEDWYFRSVPATTSPFAMAVRKRMIASGKWHDDLNINREDILVLKKP